ncbi:hypothetical protein BDP55DRAFT_752076 [Colletotrichum godetiae]|uniref:Uncharacterized protein n=1 Tax=Colletotrichum godetiae TaxID=1209918 RepID=A0AAJ0AD96_9PEZI|nr:uncharacterized protein BDP55DRAFT_752076 [Colletotrichum godetiae]KAK1671790.1 hypothetical protein BDP55DRAFT_752076 [Colletotrichum godetiae]
MHISHPVSGSPPPTLSFLILLLIINAVLGGAIATPTAPTATTQSSKRNGPAPPNRAYEAPLLGITPAPEPSAVSHRLLRARQGDPRSSDGRTNFIAWYSQSGNWVSATCPSNNYFAADGRFGVCCPRGNPYCEMATSCGGPFDNYAIGPTGQADWYGFFHILCSLFVPPARSWMFRKNGKRGWDSGPSNTCDTITMLQTQGSTDARRIIFCIAMSELYVLPMTWYRVTHPLPEASVATVTVTQSTTVTATARTGGSRMGGQPGSPSRSPPAMMALAVAVMISVLVLGAP